MVEGCTECALLDKMCSLAKATDALLKDENANILNDSASKPPIGKSSVVDEKAEVNCNS